ncbi:hypothetical protein [Micromonospora chalcea]|uniref:hypothetical protein n=1 Tax=Micromonospora chalcea TaxID=1874 RepID=UPI00331922B4
MTIRLSSPGTPAEPVPAVVEERQIADAPFTGGGAPGASRHGGGPPVLPTDQAVVVFESDGWRSYPTSGSDRAPWQQHGWGAAFDLVSDAMRNGSLPRTLSMPEALPDPSNMGAVVEHYPPVVSGARLSPAELFGAVGRCRRRYAAKGVGFHVAVVDAGELGPGWYSPDGTLLIPRSRHDLGEELSSLLPVAYGRAEFDVGASVVVSVSVDAERDAADEYMEQLWIGGLAIGELEGYGSDLGWATRGNYAVLAGFHDVVGLDSGRQLAVGAVCWAGL